MLISHRAIPLSLLTAAYFLRSSLNQIYESVMVDNIRQLSILIVDDNPVNSALLEQMLDDEGFSRLVEINDSRQVESYLTEHEVDLIILDIRMPHIDGFGILEMLKERFNDRNIPVIVVTAEEANREKALHMGAMDFLTKPFLNWEVVLRISNCLQNRLYLLNEKLRSQQLEQLVAERTREIADTQLEIARRLAIAGEYRDNETGMHVLRMSHMCRLLAELAGYDQVFCDVLLYASPLHDVGKIGISDNILLKPGRLDEAERQVMEKHVEIGHRILDGHHSELMQMAAEIALTHHEKWDGSGYPNGLSGEDIPVSGRIAAICDVVDALLSERPYKKPWPLERVLSLLQDEAGKHFDPNLVSIIVDNIDQLTDIRAKFPDEVA